MFADLPQSPQATKNTYTSTFKNSQDPNSDLQLSFDPIDDDIIRILPEDILDVGSSWSYALARHLGKEGLAGILKSWHTDVQVIPNTHGWITFVFSSSTKRDRVLSGGPYVVYGRTLLLKVLPPWFKIGTDELTTLPLWVTFPHLPLECWNVKLLSRIVSKVGTPLVIDKLTKSMECISYALVLLDVDVSKPLVWKISIIDARGVPFEQKVCFEQEPSFCPSCNTFGQLLEHCPKSVTPAVPSATSCSAVPNAAAIHTTAAGSPAPTADDTDAGLGPSHASSLLINASSPALQQCTSPHIGTDLAHPSATDPTVVPTYVQPPLLTSGTSSVSTFLATTQGPSIIHSAGQPDHVAPDGFISIILKRCLTKSSNIQHSKPLVGSPLQLIRRWILHMLSRKGGTFFLLMIISSWHMRGFNSPLKQDEVFSLIRDQ